MLNLTPAPRRRPHVQRTPQRLAACLAAVLCGAAVASLPAVAAAQLPPQVKAKPNQPANQQQIAAFVQEQLAAIKSDDPAATAAARDLLLAELSTGSPDFRTAYVDAFASRSADAFGDAPPIAQLNAAITVAKFADVSKSGALAPAARSMLASDNKVILLYGLETAAEILPEAVASGDEALVAEVVAAAEGRTDDPLVVAQVYDTLGLGFLPNQNPRVNPRNANAAVPPAVNGLLDVYRARLPLYAAGLPDTRRLEEEATLLLANRRQVFQQLDGATKLRVMQTLTDMLEQLVALRQDPALAAASADINGMMEQVGAAMGGADAALFDDASRFAGSLNTATNAATAAKLADTLLQSVQTSYPQLQRGAAGAAPADAAGEAPAAE